MLSRADAAVVERDGRLPGLRTLLDPEAFGEVLRRLAPGAGVGAARARYVRYKPRTSCLVAYEVEVGPELVGVYARCHAGDQLAKVSNSRVRLEVPGALGQGLLADPRAGIAVFVHPNDYEIRSLRTMFEGEHTPRRLRRILPAHPHLQGSTPVTLRYKPERRYVGKLEGEGGPAAVLRLYPASRFAEIREKAWAFRGGGELHVARVVGDSERYSALAHEWVEGAPLVEALGGDGEAVLERLAGALSAMHRQRPRLGTMYSASDFCRGIAGACDSVAALDEGLGRRAVEQYGAVQGLVTARAWRSQAVHGDFTADQVIVGGDRVTIVDFDRAGYGDPAMDLGAFAAGMISLALAGRMEMSRAMQLADGFASAYGRAAGVVDAVGVRACTAGALLMTAPEPFRYRLEGWPEATASLLDCVDRVLAGEMIGA